MEKTFFIWERFIPYEFSDYRNFQLKLEAKVDLETKRLFCMSKSKLLQIVCIFEILCEWKWSGQLVYPFLILFSVLEFYIKVMGIMG